MSGNFSIYTGYPWTDYTDGRLILTLPSSPSGALQAIIPLYIALLAPFSWVIIKRIWYHLSVHCENGHAPVLLLHRGEDRLLRNSAGGLTMSRDAISVWRRSRQPTALPSLRLSLMFVVGVLFWTFWQVAAILSFYIWQGKVTNLALIRSPYCGFLLFDNNKELTAFVSTELGQTILAETWVSQCYGDPSSTSSACSLYPAQSINFEVNSKAECPFTSSDICVATNSSPHQMDTGPINSHFGLGINAQETDRITYRKNTTCSPVHAKLFGQTVNANETSEASDWPPDTVLQRFFFGPIISPSVPWTYEYNTYAPLDGFGYEIT
jgi:hypothetical protein